MGIKFQQQLPVNLTFKNIEIGRYFLDFLIEGKNILEIKSGPKLYTRDVRQILAYLKSTNKPIGILANFSKKGVQLKRVLKGLE